MIQSKENLIAYYQQELEFLREFSKQFAQAHPADAGNLIPNSHTDPFIDRLIEAIGLLNARNHLKLDAEFSETCAALLEHIAPASLAPIPAMSIVQFTPKEKKFPIPIPAKTVLTSVGPMGEPCYFTTGYNVECQHIRVTQVNLSSDKPKFLNQLGLSNIYQSYLSIKLEISENIDFNGLRFFISAQPVYAYMLYELIFKHAQKIILGNSLDDKKFIILNKNHLKAEGFDAEQSLLLHHKLQNREDILLSEFFNFPEKFLFFSINNAPARYSPIKYIFILFDAINTPLEKQISSDSLALNCTPIVNIFPALSEPVYINHTQNEYHLRARLDHHSLSTEIYHIQELSAYNDQHQRVLFHPAYHPISDIQHFYHPVKRANSQSEIYLAFSTHSPKLFYHQEWIATAKILCTNRHWVNQLPYGGNSPHFYFDEFQYKDHISSIKILMPFSHIQDISREHESIIHRLLSYLLINQSPHNFLNFQRMLELFGSKNNSYHQFLTAIVKLDFRLTQSRMHTKNISHSMINGTQIWIQVDTDKIPQSHAFFFCSILERVFAFQAEINSYTSLILVNNQQEEIHRWPLRCGETELY